MLKINEPVYGVGDIHGDVTTLCFLIEKHNITNSSFILLGDIGIWRYRDYKRYMSLDKLCKERNIIVYAFRGNHDNPRFFYRSEEQSPIARRFWDKFTNFKVLPDLSIITINNSKGIVIGGGTSIDRVCRRTWQSLERRYNNLYKLNDWWEDEVLPSIGNIKDNFDFILTHTGPRPPKIMPLNEDNCGFFILDKTLEHDINEENNKLNEIQNRFKPKKWWFGHYHINDSFTFNGTDCCAVDINYITPIRL